MLDTFERHIILMVLGALVVMAALIALLLRQVYIQFGRELHVHEAGPPKTGHHRCWARQFHNSKWEHRKRGEL